MYENSQKNYLIENIFKYVYIYTKYKKKVN